MLLGGFAARRREPSPADLVRLVGTIKQVIGNAHFEGDDKESMARTVAQDIVLFAPVKSSG